MKKIRNRHLGILERHMIAWAAEPLRMSDLAQRIANRTGLFKEEVEEVFLALEHEVETAFYSYRPVNIGHIRLGWNTHGKRLQRSKSPRWDVCQWMPIEENTHSDNSL